MACVPEGLPEGLVLLVGLTDAEDHAKGRDEHLARSERTDDPNPDLPVETDGPQRRLDGMAEPATEAVAKLVGRFL